MNLTSDDEIIQCTNDIRNQIISHDVKYIKVQISSLSNVKLFIEKGFLPVFDSMNNIEANKSYGMIYVAEKEYITKAFEAYILSNLTDEEFEFWFERAFDKTINLSTHKDWIYGTIEHWKEKSSHDADSFPLLLYAPDQVYLSKRPKTEMLMFRNPDMTRMSIKQESQYHPVTRYGQGMSRGLYYKGENTDFCGTFYYVEPNSSTYLQYNKSLIFRNKYQATKTLLYLSPNRHEFRPEKIKFGGIYGLQQEYLENTSGLPDDLMLSPLEIFTKYPELFPNWTLDKVKLLPQNKQYCGRFLDLYAIEDGFDQILCILGKRANADIIVLTHMTGSHQIVSEILDTRDRNTSFDNLIYT